MKKKTVYIQYIVFIFIILPSYWKIQLQILKLTQKSIYSLVNY